MILLLGCNEFRLNEAPPPEPADPPPLTDDAFGDAPDWTDCGAGWLGTYSNLSNDHPDVETDEVPQTSDDLDWWDEVAFTRYDPTLDVGQLWWPVDEGLEDDPAYFAARFTGWVRVWSGETMEIVIGAQTAAWVLVSDEELVAVTGEDALEVVTETVTLGPGQYPIEIRFGQLRAGQSGLRFRISGGDVSQCFPAFGEE